LGLGMMGGSLGLALRTLSKDEYDVVGWTRRAEARDLARRMGCVREAFESPEGAAADADLAVLCVPILAMADVLKACAHALSPRCVVTDVGSTKAELARRLPPMIQGRGLGYCGSHPIAGSEQQGIEAARADLYRGAVVVVTPATNGGEMAQTVVRMWESVGARVCLMDAEAHDRMMARTSHLPHLVAALLSSTVGRDEGDRDVASFCGPGFRDATRIADGAPEIWKDIVETNCKHIEGELEAFQRALDVLRKAVAAGNMDDVVKILADARRRRREIMASWRRLQRGPNEHDG
jgi:prephenate dehydrogenase